MPATKRTRIRSRGPSVVTLARLVNKAITRDRYGIYRRAGITPRTEHVQMLNQERGLRRWVAPVRVIAQGATYRRPKPAGKQVSA